jgi:Family of unknown function (DUF5946)
MTATAWSTCPGCGLDLPALEWREPMRLLASAACWQLFTEVTGTALAIASPAAAVHQLSLDAYTAQHAGPDAPAISTVFGLVGLHLAVDRGQDGRQVRDAHQRLAATGTAWPRLPRPEHTGDVTVFDVALADTSTEHIAAAHRWAESVWAAWHASQPTIVALVEKYLP